MGAIELLTCLMDEAFAGTGLEAANESQSLIANPGDRGQPHPEPAQR